MKSVRKSLLGSAFALLAVAAIQLAFASPPDANNQQTTGDPTHDGPVTVNIKFEGSGSGVQASVPITAAMDARLKALEIANAINEAPSNQIPANQGGGTKCKASVGSDGSTVTVTSQNGFGPITEFHIKATTTKEDDKNTGKPQNSIGTGMYFFAGTVGTPGTVTVGVGESRFDFNVAAFTTIQQLRSAVVSTLTSHGFSAYVNPEGTIFATVPAGMDGVSLCVDCETMTAEDVGYLGD